MDTIRVHTIVILAVISLQARDFPFKYTIKGNILKYPYQNLSKTFKRIPHFGAPTGDFHGGFGLSCYPFRVFTVLL